MRVRGVSGPDFRNNTGVAARDKKKKKNVQEPTGGAAKTRNQARSLGRRDSTGGREPVLSPPQRHTMGFMALEERSETGLFTPKGRKTSNPTPGSGQSVIVPVTNAMINGREEAAGADSTSVRGWSQPGSGTAARSHRGRSPRTGRLGGGGWGRRTPPSPHPRRSFVPRYADGPRTAAPASGGFSFFVVRPVFFSPPLASRGERGRPRPSPYTLAGTRRSWAASAPVPVPVPRRDPSAAGPRHSQAPAARRPARG